MTVEENSKEYNFAQIREEKAKLEAELFALKEQLSSREASSNKIDHATLLREAGISADDPLIEVEKIPALLSAFEKKTEQKLNQMVESAINRYQADNIYSYMQADTNGSYAQTVTEDTLKQLLEEQPEEAIALNMLKDNPKLHAQYAFQKCSRFKKQKEKDLDMSTRIEQAAREGRRQSHSVSFPAAEDKSLSSLPHVQDMKRGDNAAWKFAQSLKKPSLSY